MLSSRTTCTGSAHPCKLYTFLRPLHWSLQHRTIAQRIFGAKFGLLRCWVWVWGPFCFVAQKRLPPCTLPLEPDRHCGKHTKKTSVMDPREPGWVERSFTRMTRRSRSRSPVRRGGSTDILWLPLIAVITMVISAAYVMFDWTVMSDYIGGAQTWQSSGTHLPHGKAVRDSLEVQFNLTQTTDPKFRFGINTSQAVEKLSILTCVWKKNPDSYATQQLTRFIVCFRGSAKGSATI